MSQQKIPDKSNFLKKFAAVEGFLQKKVSQQVEIKPTEPETQSLPPAVPEILTSETELHCNQCGTPRNQEDVFCGSCGIRLQ